MDYTLYRFDDVATLVNGRAYLMPELQDSGKYRIVRVGNFSGKDEWYYSDMELDDDKYCEKGDLLYKWACNFGPEIWKEEKVIYHYHIWKVLPNPEKVDKNFLYYYLLNATPTWLGGTNGTTMVHITKANMEKKKILIPTSVKEQKKIATILGDFDSLIEKNEKQIKLLEDLTTELFKEWFIRFRFPGYKSFDRKDSELGKIPSCFSIVRPQELFDYYVGGGWGNDDYSEDFPIDAFVIRGTDFPYVSKNDVSTCPYRYHKKSNYASRQLRENDFVLEISGGTADQPVGRAILVSKPVLEQLDNKVICASFCKLIRPNYKKVTPYYLLQWFKFLYDTRMIERFQLQSTGIINFKFEYFLKKGPILLPPFDLLKKFDELAKPMKEAIDNLALENASLKKQRDSLLPRLINGKLSVEGKEIV